ncbi:MAG: UvrB/UvrC motif-containing protein, partial [Alphaproteobacteria bacterium]
FPDDDSAPSLVEPGDDALAVASVAELRRAMREAAEALDFERAAALRDRLREVEAGGLSAPGAAAAEAATTRGRGGRGAPGAPARGGRRRAGRG